MQAQNFIARWTGREGGAERANYQMFLAELCDVLGVARPDVAEASAARNDYAFERAVRPRETDGGAPKRIDLYKRGCFILEAKQSRLKGAGKAPPGAPAQGDAGPRGARHWDAMMANARRQAEHYVFLLDADHPAPPFLIPCDVGHCLELYADFTGTGRAYRHFPDRRGFRVYLDELEAPATREKLAKIWSDPLSLDPARESAKVTRAIAAQLAEVSKALEADHPAEEVAHFLMRCIFTMFADGVGLLPKTSFTTLLEDCLASPKSFAPLVDELWRRMDEPAADQRYSTALRSQVPYFNGSANRAPPDVRGFNVIPAAAAQHRRRSTGSGYQRVEKIQCSACRALLFRAAPRAIAGVIEIKCRRCGAITILRPSEPTRERPERPSKDDLCVPPSSAPLPSSKATRSSS